MSENAKGQRVKARINKGFGAPEKSLEKINAERVAAGWPALDAYLEATGIDGEL